MGTHVLTAEDYDTLKIYRVLRDLVSTEQPHLNIDPDKHVVNFMVINTETDEWIDLTCEDPYDAMVLALGKHVTELAETNLDWALHTHLDDVVKVRRAQHVWLSGAFTHEELGDFNAYIEVTEECWALMMKAAAEAKAAQPRAGTC